MGGKAGEMEEIWAEEEEGSDANGLGGVWSRRIAKMKGERQGKG
jgi:hypothetical protein